MSTDYDYNPTGQEKETIDFVYDEFEIMRRKRQKEYTEFNQRTLKQFLNDSHKRVNAYAPSRESQDKDDWQSNVTLPTTRDQVKRVIAGFSLKVPDLELRCFGNKSRNQIKKSRIVREVIKGSYDENANPILDNFWECWHAAVDGTVIQYEGYLKSSYKQKFIKSYDLSTGEIDYEEKEVDVDDKCVSFTVPLLEFFIKDSQIHDIQDQPAVAWVRYFNPQEFEKEFGEYKNADQVPGSPELLDVDIDSFYKNDDWNDRVGGEKSKIEVVRYYNRFKDRYVIIANGVLLLDAPLLWKVNGIKQYPFAKSIFEPFQNKHFFYGNSTPNILQGYFDTQNTLWNTILDKEYRSLNKPLLIGTANRDALELEDEFVGTDTKIYVDDISQVDQLQLDSVNKVDITMLELISQGLDQASPDLSSLLGENDTTAREIVIAAEKMRELKSSNAEFLSDLWRQKYQLRLSNIALNWPEPRKVYKGGKVQKEYRTHVIESATLDKDGTKGTLAIEFRDDLTPEKKAKLQQEANAEAEAMKQQGVAYKKTFLGKDYLDNTEFRIKVISETLHKTSLAKMQSTVSEKLETISTFFPQIFVANQEDYFTQVAEAYEEDPERSLDNFRELQEKMAKQKQQQAQSKGQQQPQGQPRPQVQMKENA